MPVIEPIPVELEMEEVKGTLRTDDLEHARRVIEDVKPLVSARAAYRISYVDEKMEGAVVIDGIRFRSRVLRKNLEEVGRVFAYVVTIGPELEEKASRSTDLLENYSLNALGNLALRKARIHLQDSVGSMYGLGSLSFMSPGSLADWPIEEQRPLFSILKGEEAGIGVRLTESFLMIPRKSVSGILFPTEDTFYNCQLCPRERCEGRKAPYDETLAREYGILSPDLRRNA